MVIDFLCSVLNKAGISSENRGGVLVTIVDGNERKFKSDPEFDRAYESLQTSRTVQFDEKTSILQINGSVEIPLSELKFTFYFEDVEYESADKKEKVVLRQYSTHEFALKSFELEMNFEVRKKAIKRILSRKRPDVESLTKIIIRPMSATYLKKSRSLSIDLVDKAVSTVKSCLFKLSVERGQCFHIWNPSSLERKAPSIRQKGDSLIPACKYNEDLVAFYKAATSCTLPSQRFLEYYHVLEYNFLIVFEKGLHGKLAAMINDVSRKTSPENLQKVISLVQGIHSKNSSEEEMLRMVIEEYVTKEELTNFVNEYETEVNRKVYTKSRDVFGEKVQMDIANHRDPRPTTATMIKVIRNAIVHSSDKYGRSDRHIPLTKSDEIIAEFIPLVEFLARKVIYGQVDY